MIHPKSSSIVGHVLALRQISVRHGSAFWPCRVSVWLFGTISASRVTVRLFGELGMRDFLSKLGMKQEKFLLHCDNQSAIHLAKNVAYTLERSTFKEGIIGCVREWKKMSSS